MDELHPAGLAGQIICNAVISKTTVHACSCKFFSLGSGIRRPIFAVG
jgi:hypothetical protein